MVTKNTFGKAKITPNQVTLKNVTPNKITLNGYQKLLSEAQNLIKQMQSNIIKNVTREKVVVGWQLGKLINEHLAKNNSSGYGEKLLEQLTKDLSMSKSVLYQMRSFYQTYPRLPKNESRLNWSHYRVLSGIKKTEERKYLEDLTKQNNWDGKTLQAEVKNSKNSEATSEEILKTKTKNGNGKFAKKDVDGNVISKAAPNKKLYPVRGKLFSYPLIKLTNSEKTFIDCGFNFFKEFKDELPKASAVDVTKKKENYSFNKSDTHPRKFNTYKAYLDRVVDGDTIRVTIDLGFESFHNEIIRLKGIDAPEIATDAGKKSSKTLSNILKDAPFLIIKTMKNDIYGRYVADVFLAGKEMKIKGKSVVEIDPQKVADTGIYLNQLLLDKGFAVVVNM